MYHCRTCANRGGVSFEHLTTGILKVFKYELSGGRFNLLWTRGKPDCTGWGESFNISSVNSLSRHGNIITTLSRAEADILRHAVLNSGVTVKSIQDNRWKRNN